MAEGKIEEIEERIDNLETTISDLEDNDFEDHETRIDDLEDQDFDDLEGRVNTLESEMCDALSYDISEMHEEAESLEERIADLEVKLNEALTMVKELSKNIEYKVY